MENPVKKTLTCGASYKPPVLPGDTYTGEPAIRLEPFKLARKLRFLNGPTPRALRRPQASRSSGLNGFPSLPNEMNGD
jgi:hypothetical protein